MPLASVRGLIERHEIDDGATLTVLLFLIAFGVDGRRGPEDLERTRPMDH
jgi:hypothetical protein